MLGKKLARCHSTQRFGRREACVSVAFSARWVTIFGEPVGKRRAWWRPSVAGGHDPSVARDLRRILGGQAAGWVAAANTKNAKLNERTQSLGQVRTIRSGRLLGYMLSAIPTRVCGGVGATLCEIDLTISTTDKGRGFTFTIGEVPILRASRPKSR
jgi:hypothetical protein